MKITCINNVYSKNLYNKTKKTSSSNHQLNFGNGKNGKLAKDTAKGIKTLLRPLPVVIIDPHPPMPFGIAGALLIASKLFSEKDGEKKEENNTVDNKEE